VEVNMSNIDVHFSSESNEWGTPRGLFDWLNTKHNFTLDAAASWENFKCTMFYSREMDALKQDWLKDSNGGSVFLNPPYGRLIGEFIKKAYEESIKGCNVVCLIPARTDTKFWHHYCQKGEVTFIKGRLKFVKDEITAPAPFPSAIVRFQMGIIPRTFYINQVWNKAI